jgi:prophage antirepressor-like protein
MKNIAPTNKAEVAIYQPNNFTQVEVIMENETVWLTQQQIADLFGTKRQAITKHLKNIFDSGELEIHSVSSILEHTASDGKNYQTKFYSLDAILSVGYRVNSKNATLFRIWANKVLKEYLMKGYAVHQRFERIEERVSNTERQIDFFVKTALPPVEGIFYDGQIIDAYTFVSDLIKTAKKSIVLIDNYVGESVLLLLSKSNKKVFAKILTSNFNTVLKQDLQKHNAQYPPIEIEKFTKSHDRFLIIDNDTYHIGASLKDLGKKWFAFSKIKLNPNSLLPCRTP